MFSYVEVNKKIQSILFLRAVITQVNSALSQAINVMCIKYTLNIVCKKC